MKWKNLEALFYLAIALSVVEWSPSRRNTQTDLIPEDLIGINGQPNLFNPNLLLQDHSRLKEEQTVLDNILSWEESQKRGDWSPEQNLLALPLVGQNSGRPLTSSVDSDDCGYNSGASSPSACSEREELLGAVGYTPSRRSDDFDFAELILHDTFSHVSSSDGVNISKLPKDLDEGVDDDFEQFLQASIGSSQFKIGNNMVIGDFDPFVTDVSVTSQSNMPEDLTDTFLNIDDVDVMRHAHGHHGGAIHTLADAVSNIKTEEIEDLFLTNLENAVSTDKMLLPQYETEYECTDKDSFPDFTSYFDDDLLHDSLFQTEKQIKKEKSSSYEADLLKTSKGAKLKIKHSILPDLPYTEDVLINMPVEKFNTILQTLDAASQLVARDLRRKGKNRGAARNCRKRKIDEIDNLDTDVSHMESKRYALLEESRLLLEETEQINRKTELIYNHIFDSLRDENGLPYSPLEYSLEHTSDGSVYLVPHGQTKTIIKTTKNTQENREIESSK